VTTDAITGEIAAAELRVSLERERIRNLGRGMAGDKFFALVDELDSADRQLDDMAEPLHRKLQGVLARASRAVDVRHARLDAASDYIARLDGVVEKIEQGNAGIGANKGPTVEGSETSSGSSPDATGAG
jgi:hypothetical protein